MEQLAELQAKAAATFDKYAFMAQVNSLNTAKEIYELMERVYSDNKAAFPEDLMNIMK